MLVPPSGRWCGRGPPQRSFVLGFALAAALLLAACAVQRGAPAPLCPPPGGAVPHPVDPARWLVSGGDTTLLWPSPWQIQPPVPPVDPGWLHTVPTYGADGSALGPQTSWDVHTRGLWHKDVFVLLWRGGRVLLQLRSNKKWAYPGVFDFSASETMEEGESFEAAARRAVDEEVVAFAGVRREGVQLSRCCGPRHYVWEGQMRQMFLRDYTMVEVWEGAFESDLHAVEAAPAYAAKADGEVGGFRWVSPAELRSGAAGGASRYGPWLLDALYNCPSCRWGPS
eukprot:TRINITY_DN35007_c0_g1_i2.p1 TRINITY_DN35007_c0_g1~~TRINITY_DN35007_c0_g1_i2.p1  ORF type:complete len:282 (+),score=52.75 TRINITY_DN35007_c0_g1_i2:78-923(+)